MRQRILGLHTPPGDGRMVITTQFSVLPCCAAAGGDWGGGLREGQVGVVGGGVQVGRFELGGGGHAPLTSPCLPSNHTISITITT